MRWLNVRIFLLVVGLLAIIFIILQFYSLQEDDKLFDLGDEPVILWWTPFGSEETLKTCENVRCYFTQDGNHANHKNLKAILFYGSNFEINDLPIPRRPNVRWGLLHEESPRNNLIFVHEEALNLFNFSSTFSRFSDVPLTLVDLPSEGDLTGDKFFIDTEEKNRLLEEKNLSSILYLQSNCDTLSERDSYVAELMKYTRIDSYGACLKNRDLPEDLATNYIDKLNSDELEKFIAKYKFTLAMENAICDDYITEKLWRPLIVGSVPIYYGSPSFKDWLPNNKSAIAITDFENPEHLALFINHLNSHDLFYEQYLSHKLVKSGVTNRELLKYLRDRPKKMINPFEYYLRQFECDVCKKIHGGQSKIMTKREYSCKRPNQKFNFNELNGRANKNWWSDVWEIEKCAGKLLAQHLRRNQSFDAKEFSERKMKMFHDNEC